MQKIVNILAIASTVVSLAVVGTAGYVYVRKDAIIEDIKEKALGSVMGGMGGDLPIGTPDLAPPAGLSSTSGLGLPAPSSPL